MGILKLASEYSSTGGYVEAGFNVLMIECGVGVSKLVH